MPAGRSRSGRKYGNRGVVFAFVIVRMWEVRGHPARLPELVGWVCDTALPAIEHDPRHAGSEVFSATDRVVVISRWRGEPVPLPDPPAELVARPAHAWDFTPVDR
jgi:hypothetical protein